MNPTVLAAIIGVAGTVIVAFIGFMAQARTSNLSTSLAIRVTEIAGLAQMTSAWSNAIDQVASDNVERRIGGIYALEQVARDSPREHPTVIEVLAAFVRGHSHEPWPQAEPDAKRQRAEPDTTEPEYLPRPDVQAAVTVIGRREASRDRERVDLHDVNLSGASLSNLNLAGVALDYATLIDTTFIHTNLTGTTFFHANLTRAAFFGANLTNANLESANLTKAHFSGRDTFPNAALTGADLRDADLTDVDFTGVDLTDALMDENQPVPDGWQRDPDSGRLRPA
jgi:hypothetical protein